MEDAGKITAKTNADETSCDLGVKRKYIKRMSIQKFLTYCLKMSFQGLMQLQNLLKCQLLHVDK